MEDMRKHRGIKLVTKERRRNYLVSELIYHITNIFKENVLAIEMKKRGIYKSRWYYKDVAENVETRFDLHIMNLIDHWLRKRVKR